MRITSLIARESLLKEKSMRNGMVLTMLEPFVMSARECAVQMLQNGMYIQKELPNVKMSDTLRQRTAEVCGRLLSTKHDLINELYGLKDLVGTDAPDAQIAERVSRIVLWAREDLVKLHEVVTAVIAESEQTPEAGVASLLLTESATNMLRAYTPMHSAAEAVLRAVQGGPEKRA
jgi:hypothetical protein